MYHKLIDDICFLKSLIFKNKLTVGYPTRWAKFSIQMRIWMGAPAPMSAQTLEGGRKKEKWHERRGREKEENGEEREKVEKE